MTHSPDATVDPELDLVLQRDVAIAPDAVWRAWTEPDLLVQWFTPRPWRTTEAEIELHPGGMFRTVMQGPAGEAGGGTGCILEVVPGRRLVWTGALLPGFRPAVVTTHSHATAIRATVVAKDGGDAGRRPTCSAARPIGTASRRSSRI